VNGYLLDTNVPSEYSRPRPDMRVLAWLRSQPASSLYVSAVTIGEIRRGLDLLPSGQKKLDLETWYRTTLPLWFGERVLPVSRTVAERWGALDAQCQRKGTPLNTADGMIAATALEHDLKLVTRNIRDFAGTAVPIFNPWE
jgi:predicted nucleic acid-binding protein